MLSPIELVSINTLLFMLLSLRLENVVRFKFA